MQGDLVITFFAAANRLHIALSVVDNFSRKMDRKRKAILFLLTETPTWVYDEMVTEL